MNKTTPNGNKFEEIIFSFTGKPAKSCEDYGQIKKTDSEYDSAIFSDDVIILELPEGTDRVHIDCNKETGEFKVFFPLRTK